MEEKAKQLMNVVYVEEKQLNYKDIQQQIKELGWESDKEMKKNKVPRETNKRCPICHELCPEDDMIDTEGMVNGGIGTICPDCAENGDVGR